MLKQLYRHVEYGHVHKTFYFNFFDNFKYIKNTFQIKDDIHPREKKNLSRQPRQTGRLPLSKRRTKKEILGFRLNLLDVSDAGDP
jgi:hypothetical protein